jgi:hypothetical protein
LIDYPNAKDFFLEATTELLNLHVIGEELYNKYQKHIRTIEIQLEEEYNDFKTDEYDSDTEEEKK